MGCQKHVAQVHAVELITRLRVGVEDVAGVAQLVLQQAKLSALPQTPRRTDQTMTLRYSKSGESALGLQAP